VTVVQTEAQSITGIERTRGSQNHYVILLDLHATKALASRAIQSGILANGSLGGLQLRNRR
jgi:hypothetical protein